MLPYAALLVYFLWTCCLPEERNPTSKTINTKNKEVSPISPPTIADEPSKYQCQSHNLQICGAQVLAQNLTALARYHLCGIKDRFYDCMEEMRKKSCSIYPFLVYKKYHDEVMRKKLRKILLKNYCSLHFYK